MRLNQTPSELTLGQALSTAGKCEYLPQFPFRGMIFDFYCRDHRVVIEVDGAYHLTSQAIRSDSARDNRCKAQGLKVVRIPATQILEHPQAAALQAIAACQGRRLHLRKPT